MPEPARVTVCALLAMAASCQGFVAVPQRLRGVHSAIAARRTAPQTVPRLTHRGMSMQQTIDTSVQVESPFAAPGGRGFGDSGDSDDDDGPLPLTLENVEKVSKKGAACSELDAMPDS